MNDFVTMLQTGNAWFYIPSAILLGILHGLEPGHSKTMMAAFIVAIRGTFTQAILLGLAATFSHTAVVWAVAMGGLYFGQNLNAETSEPYFQIASAVLIIAIAVWMIWATKRNLSNSHGHDHAHTEDEHIKHIDTGHGRVALELYETQDLCAFRFRNESGHAWTAEHVNIEIERPDGQRQAFSFVQREGFLESVQTVAEPHEFVARLRLGDDHHSHDFDVEFVEHDHDHHAIKEYDGLDVSAPGYQDPHELAHANDIRRRFKGQQVTNWQIVLFGLTGGLIPCPAAITVLLFCLQLKKITLGATLVLGFSVGLAITLVASGALAAFSVRQVTKRWSGFGDLARKAPYFSSVIIIFIGLWVGWHGLVGLNIV